MSEEKVAKKLEVIGECEPGKDRNKGHIPAGWRDF